MFSLGDADCPTTETATIPSSQIGDGKVSDTARASAAKATHTVTPII